MRPEHEVTWSIVPPEDEDIADYVVEVSGEAYGEPNFYNARCKRDGCIDFWWGHDEDGKHDEYEHICDLRDKIELLISLFNVAYNEWQERGGGEGCWLDPLEELEWEERGKRAMQVMAARRAGLFIP